MGSDTEAIYIPIRRKASRPLKRCLRCDEWAAKLRSGPDGHRTLCGKCGTKYRFGSLQLFIGLNGSLSVIKTRGSTEVSGYGFISDSSKRDLTKPFVFSDTPSQARVPLQEPETKSEDVVGELMMMTAAGGVEEEPSEIVPESFPTDSTTSVQVVDIFRSSNDVSDIPNRTQGGGSSTEIQSTGIRAETTESDGRVESKDEPIISKRFPTQRNSIQGFRPPIFSARNTFPATATFKGRKKNIDVRYNISFEALLFLLEREFGSREFTVTYKDGGNTITMKSEFDTKRFFRLSRNSAMHPIKIIMRATEA